MFESVIGGGYEEPDSSITREDIDTLPVHHKWTMRLSMMENQTVASFLPP
jgi:hypothetical protein